MGKIDGHLWFNSGELFTGTGTHNPAFDLYWEVFKGISCDGNEYFVENLLRVHLNEK